jgi:protein-L-isoaspartate O-methyltransferase
MSQLELFDNNTDKYEEVVLDFPKTNPSVKLIDLKPKPNNNTKIIETLRKGAQSCINQSEKINTEVSGNWTHRRQRFADSAQHKKDSLIRRATALNRLAMLWETDDCPEILKGIRSPNDFETYYPKPPDDDCPIGGWYREEYPAKLKKALKIGLKGLDDNQIFKNAIQRLSEIVLTPEQQKERDLQEMLKKVHAMNIPGFFPTPDELIDQMIELAELDPSHSILEPSAGMGNILDRIKEHGHKGEMHAVERMHSLHEILLNKGYTSFCDDIMELVPGRIYDRIIMNPPFEKAQDIDHVTHCFNNFLKEGGILVSIMSAGTQTNTTKKHETFRELVDEHGYFVSVSPGAFKNAFNSTGISVCIVVLKK